MKIICDSGEIIDLYKCENCNNLREEVENLTISEHIQAKNFRFFKSLNVSEDCILIRTTKTMRCICGDFSEISLESLA